MLPVHSGLKLHSNFNIFKIVMKYIILTLLFFYFWSISFFWTKLFLLLTYFITCSLDHQVCHIYCKVTSSRLSLLVALPRIFRRLMKGKFDAYVLWPLAKKFQNWIVDQSTARNFTVPRRAKKDKNLSTKFMKVPKGFV